MSTAPLGDGSEPDQERRQSGGFPSTPTSEKARVELQIHDHLINVVCAHRFEPERRAKATEAFYEALEALIQARIAADREETLRPWREALAAYFNALHGWDRAEARDKAAALLASPTGENR